MVTTVITWANGDLMLPEPALGELAAEGIRFSVNDELRDDWGQHFVRDSARSVGTTATGRTTAWLLELNTGNRLRWRELANQLGLLD